MFINATGLLDCRELFFEALCSIHCAKYYFSLPLINFPLSLNILFPLHVGVSSQFLDSSCVLIPVCASFYTVLSPPLSPSSCLVFSWAVCWVCCWWELCTIGHEGMKIFSQAVEFTRLKCTENTCFQNCDTHKTNQQR